MKTFLRRIYHRLPVISQLRSHTRQATQKAWDIFFTNLALESAKLEFAFSQSPRYGDPKRLLRYGLQANSQNLEDGMIWEIFRRIGTTSRTFAEIGVESGVQSNT